MSNSNQTYIDNFLEKLKAEDGLSNNTILSYGKDLELFLQFLEKRNLKFFSVNSEVLKEYLYQLHQKNLRSSSVSRKISTLKSFYKFLQDENLIKDLPTLYLQNPKPDKKLPKFLSEEEIFKMLDFINRDKSEFGIKLSSMLEILYASGLRVSELVGIEMSAIQEDYDENGQKTLRNYLIVRGKGNKERIAPLNKSAIKMLIEYLELRKKSGLQNSKWLFVGKVRSNKKTTEIKVKNYLKNDSHITRQRFHKMLKELALKVNIDPKRVHPHVIRHSFATHLLNNGVDLRILQELLGHSDISTTEIYTHILDSKLRDLVLKHHPLANLWFIFSWPMTFSDQIKRRQNVIKGHEISIKLTRSKYDEIMKKFEDDNGDEEENNSDKDNSFDEKQDLKEQAKMLKKIIEEQQKKEASEMQKLEEEKERQQQEENEKNNEEKIFEIILAEEEFRKIQKLLESNNVKFIDAAIQKILDEGPFGNHENGSKERSH